MRRELKIGTEPYVEETPYRITPGVYVQTDTEDQRKASWDEFELFVDCDMHWAIVDFNPPMIGFLVQKIAPTTYSLQQVCKEASGENHD